MQHVSHVATRNLESIFFATPSITLHKRVMTSLCETYKRIPRNALGSPLSNDRKTLSREHRCGSLYNQSCPFGERLWRQRQWREKPWQSQDPFLAAWLSLVLFIPRPCSPQSIVLSSFFAEFKVRRQIHERPRYMLIRLRLHRRKGVEP